MPIKIQTLRNFILAPGENSTEASTARLSLVDRLAQGIDLRFARPRTPKAHDAAAHILGPNVVNRRILTVAEPSSPLHEHLGWLDRHTLGVYAFGTLDEADAAAQVSPDATLTLVSLDMCFNLNVAFDMLSAYRRRAPERVTVIASQMFSQHDMTCERASIADASLRLPASRAELALCLGAAVTNNGYVQSRRRLV
jgi:hypothetical protein